MMELKMADLPAIKVSEKDMDQLEAMLERKEHRDNPALDGLRSELERAEIVPLEQLPEDVVRMNSTVTFKVEESGKTFQRTLCYPHQVATREDGISIVAPIGSALLANTAMCASSRSATLERRGGGPISPAMPHAPCRGRARPVRAPGTAAKGSARIESRRLATDVDSHRAGVIGTSAAAPNPHRVTSRSLACTSC
jgi:regulator of nucleoside diphosphate kinase